MALQKLSPEQKHYGTDPIIAEGQSERIGNMQVQPAFTFNFQLPMSVRTLIDRVPGLVLCGGAIRDLLLGQPVKDYDFCFVREIARGQAAADASWSWNEYSAEEVYTRLHGGSLRELKETETILLSILGGWLTTAKMKVSERATTFISPMDESSVVQVLHREFVDIANLFDTFDFTVCHFALWDTPTGWQLASTPEAWRDLACKTLVSTPDHAGKFGYPLSALKTLARLFRFSARGWRIDTDSVCELLRDAEGVYHENADQKHSFGKVLIEAIQGYEEAGS